MGFEKLSAEDQQLVSYDFGDELEKEAAETAAAINECYAYGHEKIAGEFIAKYDAAVEEQAKIAAEGGENDDEDDDEEMDEESEKEASQRGAFIEKGFFDRLVKEGAARHGDELYYLDGYVEQKIAASLMDTARKMYQSAKGGISKGYQSAKGGISKGTKAAKGYANKKMKQTAEGAKDFATGVRGSKEIFGVKQPVRRSSFLVGGLKDLAKGTAPVTVPLGIGAAGYGIGKAVKNKKEDK